MAKQRRVLFLCNTVYQIIVASWLRKTLYGDDFADVIVSDHMNDFEKIAKRIENTQFFDGVYTAKSREYVNNWLDFSITGRIKTNLLPNLRLKKKVKLKRKYDVLLMSNCDSFSMLLYNALKNNKRSSLGNKNMELCLFEDGTYTYSRAFYEHFSQTEPEYYTKKLEFLNKTVFNLQYIKGSVSALYLFNPELLDYDADMKIEKTAKIDCKDVEFKNYLNEIFAYAKSKDVYDKKYIFLEESIFMDWDERPDLKLVDKIADVVGKDNIMVKIHPRNPKNVFKENGYKTNENTSIPWELIVLNTDMSDKVLISISSTALLNPVSVFGLDVRAYSLMKCIDRDLFPNSYKNGLLDTVERSYNCFAENIKICDFVTDVI